MDYEAYPTSADGIGVFLTLASNGVDALRVLGADAAALAVASRTPGITVRSGSGKRLGPTASALAQGPHDRHSRRIPVADIRSGRLTVH